VPAAEGNPATPPAANNNNDNNNNNKLNPAAAAPSPPRVFGRAEGPGQGSGLASGPSAASPLPQAALSPAGGRPGRDDGHTAEPIGPRGGEVPLHSGLR